MTVMAADASDYTYDVLEDGSASITGYTGSDTEIIIPSTIDGYTVTQIEDITSDTGEHQALVKVTIPDTVMTIGDWAFSGCTNLEEIVMSEGVTSIGDWAFEDCEKLSSITMPDSVVSFGAEVFSDTAWLNNYVEDMIYIEHILIGYQGSDAKVGIPETITVVAEYAFSGVSDVTEVTIPSSVISIGSSAFNGCHDLEDITVDVNNTVYSSVDGVLYDVDQTTLICCPCKKTSITIPDGVESIGYEAFVGCEQLTSLVIPSSVTNIADEAFNGYYPDLVIYIEEGNTYLETYMIEHELDYEFLASASVEDEDTTTEDTTTEDTTTEVPKTGDATNTILFMCFGTISLLGMGIVVNRKRSI